MREGLTFEDGSVISFIPSEEKLCVKTVQNEIKRGRLIHAEREFVRESKLPKLKPLYYEERKLRSRKARPMVYKCQWYCCPRNIYEYKCNHRFGNYFIERDILTPEEHINMLAQPKLKEDQRKPRELKLFWVKKYLPNATSRIERLSIPRARRIEDVWKTFQRHLSARQLDNLSKLLWAKENECFNPIEKAIALTQEEVHQERLYRRRVKQETKEQQEKILKKRKCQIERACWVLFEIMKEFLMNENTVKIEGDMKYLSCSLFKKIKEFSGYDKKPEECTAYVNKFLEVLANNLTIWIEKFITTYGFASLAKAPVCKPPEKPCCIEKDVDVCKRLPIEDYIPLSSEENEEEGEALYEESEPFEPCQDKFVVPSKTKSGKLYPKKSCSKTKKK